MVLEEFSIQIPMRRGHPPARAAHPAQVGPSSLVHICTQLFFPEKQQHQRRNSNSLTHSNSLTIPSVKATFQELITNPRISHLALCCPGSHRLGGILLRKERRSLVSLCWHRGGENPGGAYGTFPAWQKKKKNQLHCTFLPQSSLSWPREGGDAVPEQ